jgi:tetratricopeptide (TPR) repeat protein
MRNDPRDEIRTGRRLMHQGEHAAALELLEHQPGGDPERQLLKGLCGFFLKREESRILLKAVLDVPPENPDWQSDLALAFLFCGDPQRADSLLADLIARNQADAVAYGRMGAVHLALNRLDEACECYREAVRREPGRSEWHNNLAGILARQQKLEEALENYDIALGIKPELEQAQQSRQRVLVALERTEEVVADLQQALAQRPEDHAIKLRLARAYNLDNRPAEAIRLLRQGLKPVEQTPKGADDYDAQWRLRGLLGEIFAERSLNGPALGVLDQMARMAPDNPVPIICRQAAVLAELGRYDAALEKLDALEKDHPDQNQIRTSRANILCETGDYAQAEGILRTLLETYPGDARLLAQLGQTLLWVGDLDEAGACFERASRINPMALAQMVNARKIPDDPRALQKMRAVADNILLPEAARETMSFALATVYENRKDYGTAFHYLALANRLTDKGLGYDADGFTRQTDAVAEIFNADFFAGLGPIRKSDRTPIFVVGMPRSGTTLTEQILSSHPRVFGAGELPIIPRLTGLLPRVLKVRQPFPWCVTRMTPHLREEAARHYLFGLCEFDREHQLVVDKMPHNFVNLGLIAMIFPTARIIHVNRDPRDTAVSNFQQNFKAKHGGMGYAFNLNHIARQINDYHRLMDHWRRVLPLPIFELSYEQMVEDMEGTARKLLDFVGAEWHEEVTRFYETKRAVRTASVTQVRQPIYKSSMQKWKRYEAYLGELLKNLDPAVTARYDRPEASDNPYESRIVRQGRIVPF